MNDSLASARYQTARQKTPVSVALHRLTSLRGVIAAWEDRKRFRWDLEQMSKANPHLIDDIGLTQRQVAAEIAKPFWQA